MTQPGSGGLGKSRANVIMRPRRLVPLLKLAVAEQHHPERSLPPQSHCGTEGDPGDATAAARAPGALPRNGITSRRVSGATLHQVPLPSTPVAVSGGKDIMPGRLLRP